MLDMRLRAKVIKFKNKSHKIKFNIHSLVNLNNQFIVDRHIIWVMHERYLKYIPRYAHIFKWQPSKEPKNFNELNEVNLKIKE